jgi:hypothetical protein
VKAKAIKRVMSNASWTTKKMSDDLVQHVTSVKGKYGEADIVITEADGKISWAVHGDSIEHGDASSVEQAKTIATKKAHEDVDSQYKKRAGGFR